VVIPKYSSLIRFAYFYQAASCGYCHMGVRISFKIITPANCLPATLGSPWPRGLLMLGLGCCCASLFPPAQTRSLRAAQVSVLYKGLPLRLTWTSSPQPRSPHSSSACLSSASWLAHLGSALDLSIGSEAVSCGHGTPALQRLRHSLAGWTRLPC
jgi:hypothetical protein